MKTYLIKTSLVILSFGLSLTLATVISFGVIGPNITGIGQICIPLICGFPVAAVLLQIPFISNKIAPSWNFAIPAIVFFILFGLFLSFTLYARTPENTYKAFVQDPIPAGVSNIQARDISGGFDTAVVIACNTNAQVVDNIIADYHLELNPDSFNNEDQPFEYFPNIDRNQEWTFYMKFDKARTNWFFLWVNHDKTIALFRLIDG